MGEGVGEEVSNVGTRRPGAGGSATADDGDLLVVEVVKAKKSARFQ